MLLSTLAFMAASACGQQGSDMSNEKFATQKDAALYQAAAKGDLTQARQLLAEGASLNSRNAREMTPLDVAMVEGNRRAFDSLLELGADPTWLGDARDTSMHLAAILHDSRWLAVLLKRGFSTEVKNALWVPIPRTTCNCCRMLGLMCMRAQKTIGRFCTMRP